MSDILLALGSGDLAMLTLLDLSVASDTVNHYITHYTCVERHTLATNPGKDPVQAVCPCVQVST